MQQVWDESLRYNYPLTSRSVVLDLGGFEGDYAAGIYSRYQCNVVVFEPVKQYYEIIKSRFHGNEKVYIFNCGLGAKDQTINIAVTGSSTSILNQSQENTQVIEIKDALPVISQFPKVDLIKINIEGAEYDLLDYIIDRGLQKKLCNIQVQFHMNVPDYQARRQAIRSELSKTHHLTFDFAYTHENWEVN